jgi:signal recognition particle receptor subunit beta
VDSTDRQQELLSKMELFNLLINEDLKNAVFLIMANKQDLKDAMNESQITEKLCLTEIKNHEWRIQVR